jgi:HTH-type transcriptional regulator / antitoxin HipB
VAAAYAFADGRHLYACAHTAVEYAIAYIDLKYAIAYDCAMQITVRTSKQAGDAIRRIRRQRSLTQAALGDRMHVRQATISKLEAGEPATQLRILMDALAALDLEVVIRPRSSVAANEIEKLF